MIQNHSADSNDLLIALNPLLSMFSFTHLESILYAYLPTCINRYIQQTGIYAVDTFIITVTLIHSNLSTVKGSTNEISVIIDPCHQDDYHSIPNVYYQALSHLISKHAQTKSEGSYRLKTAIDVNQGTLEPPVFNMVPQPEQTHTIDYMGHSYMVSLQSNNSPPDTLFSSYGPRQILPGSEFSKPGIRGSHSDDPCIRLSVVSTKDKARPNVATVSKFLRDITKDYLLYTDSIKNKVKSRYDYTSSGKWTRISSLYEIQGLDTVALSPQNESLLKEDINSFMQNKPFYKRIGFPYRRGYLLHGLPGIGKTSLVFAITSQLQRDVYFMNLGYIDSDPELVQAFVTIPSNSIIVFEDIDTMSPSIQSRSSLNEQDDYHTDKYKFSLGTFLSILDGHTLEDGILFVMTTNHPERIDPAIIRPGRMDLHLQMTYSTHHQMEGIYNMIKAEDDTSKLVDIYPDYKEDLPEMKIPPSEIMQVMVLCRNKKELIPGKMRQLIRKYP
ncbi:P-loop containing nucleoside triphosphate hydrolase protein [Pilobolus umbonatus]|nr:P-loop containing nucleoside triphosphate hydrolase protein [Pilobolus umbonatus]